MLQLTTPRQRNKILSKLKRLLVLSSKLPKPPLALQKKRIDLKLNLRLKNLKLKVKNKQLLLKKQRREPNSNKHQPVRKNLELKCKPRLPKPELISKQLDLLKRKLLLRPLKNQDLQLSNQLKRRKSKELLLNQLEDKPQLLMLLLPLWKIKELLLLKRQSLMQSKLKLKL